jgi:hypothetical protein
VGLDSDGTTAGDVSVHGREIREYLGTQLGVDQVSFIENRMWTQWQWNEHLF